VRVPGVVVDLQAVPETGPVDVDKTYPASTRAGRAISVLKTTVHEGAYAKRPRPGSSAFQFQIQREVRTCEESASKDALFGSAMQRKR